MKKRKLNYQHIAEFFGYLFATVVFVWLLLCVIDIDLHNGIGNPHYGEFAAWNLFALILK